MPGETNNTTRDSTQREDIYRRYADSLADDIGGQRGADLAEQIELGEQGYGRDRDRPHEQRVKKDQYERVQEINSEFLDTKLEEYLSRTLETEQKMQEKKYGRGFLGRARRFLNETTLGKSLKLAGKATIGGLCMAGIAGTGGLAAPLLFSLGTSTLVDTAAEAAQYFGFERGRLRQIRDSRATRTQQILRAMEIRNIIHNDDDRATGVEQNVTLAAGTRTAALRDELASIIQSLDCEEQNIIGQERELARIRTIGSALRGVLKLASSGAALGYGLTHGLSLGVQEFDGIKGAHEVMLSYSNGLSFIRTAAETTAAGGSALGSVGTVAPWPLLYAAGVGTAGALLANAGASFAESSRQSQVEQNPKDEAVFSLRDRDRLGNTENELSNIASNVPPTEESTLDRAGRIRENKTAMETPGQVWRWVRNDSKGRQDETFVVNGYNAEGLIYTIIDPDTGEEGERRIYRSDGAGEPFYTARKLANSRDEFVNNIKNEVDPAVKSVCEARHVEVPMQNQVWNAGSVIDINRTDGSSISINADQKIRIEQIGEHSKTARVSVLNADGTEDAGKSGVYNVVDIVNNFTPSKEGSGEKKSSSNKWEDIKNKIKEINGIDIDKNQVWTIGNRWYVIGDILPDAGRLMVHSGEFTDRAGWNSIREGVKSYPPVEMKFDDFLNEIMSNSSNVAFNGNFTNERTSDSSGARRSRSGGGTRT